MPGSTRSKKHSHFNFGNMDYLVLKNFRVLSRSHGLYKVVMTDIYLLYHKKELKELTV